MHVLWKSKEWHILSKFPCGFPDENAAYRIVLGGTATETGERFVEALVVNIAKVLNTHSARVAEFVEEPRCLRALAFWADGQMIRDFEMEIDGTPCEALIETAELIHHPDNILEIFPNNSSLKNIGAVSYMGVPLLDSGGKILGNLAVLDTRPLPKEQRAEALMRIFAARAAAELQRLKAELEIQRREEKYRHYLKTGLAAGQVIVIGTDGIWEAFDRDGKMYGPECFRDIIRRNAHRPASAIIGAVYDDVNRFSLGRMRQDDMTLVVVKVGQGLGQVGNRQIQDRLFERFSFCKRYWEKRSRT